MPPELDRAALAAYGEVVERLFARRNFDQQVRSEQARQQVLAEIASYLRSDGSPERRRTVHVTGSNGKGSTAILVEAILRRAGARTLLETSPHLQEVTERIAIDGRPLSVEAFTRLAQWLLADPRCQRWSFFDLVTVLGFFAARERACDWQVLEVGIGGRLDTTNLVTEKSVAIITSIELEHTAILGDTIAQIAAEKAAIATCACDVLIGASVAAEAVVRVRQAAARVEARVHLLAEECRAKVLASSRSEQVIELRTPIREYTLRLAMLGTHQVDNAAAAVRAAELALGDSLSEEAVAAALVGVRNPGRMEVFEGRPLIILDALHTADAAQRFRESIEQVPLPAARALVVGVLSDKRLAQLAAELAPLASGVYVAPVDNARTADPAEVAQAFIDQGMQVARASSIRAAIEAAEQSIGPDGVVFVVGGVYTVAEARAFLVEADGV